MRTKPAELVEETTTSASLERGRQCVEPRRAAAQRFGEPRGAVERPVRDDRDRRPTRTKVSCRRLARATRPDEHDPPSLEAVEHLLGERRRGSRDGRGALADRGLDPGPSARLERHPEEPVEERARRRRLEGVPHLAQDLALAGHERVEPGRDAEEVERGGLVGADGRARARARRARSPASVRAARRPRAPRRRSSLAR